MEDAKHGRDAFRVQQELIFEFQPVTAELAESATAGDFYRPGAASSLLSQLHQVDQEANQILRLLGEKNRLLADFLRSLNQKVELIARFALLGDEPLPPAVTVSYSETGVMFTQSAAIKPGTLLALRLVFLPAYESVCTFARVVRTDYDGQTYQIAAEFYKLCQQDQQTLARQVMKAQVQSRKRHAKPES